MPPTPLPQLAYEVSSAVISKHYHGALLRVHALLKLWSREIRAPKILYLAKEILSGRGSENSQTKHYYCGFTFVN